MNDSLVQVEPGPITTVRLDNPPLNLVTVGLTKQLGGVLEDLAADEGLRCVILTGTGDRAFSAGSDVKEFEGLKGRVGEGKLILEKAVYMRLARLPVPTIAAIQGDALGGGLELALCCDLRVADEKAKLGLPEVRLGVIPGSGGTQILPRIIGPARAKQMILTGEIIDAPEAARIGLVNRVASSGEAHDTALSVAETIAARAPLAVREAKRAIDATGSMTLDDGLALELEASEHVFASEDMIEGARAFIEKRPPRFTGE